MKRALITGVSGQDGSYLAELLASKGYEVYGLVRRISLPNYSRLSQILSCSNFKLIEGEISDSFSVYSIIENNHFDEVYNLAAQSHVATSFEQPMYTFDVNTRGPLNFLEAIRKYSPTTKFYQASTSEMFGKNYTESYDEYGGPTFKYQDEKTSFIPQSPYAIAKLAAHHLVRNYRESYNIFACSGILFNHESERRGEQFVTRKITKWIGDFIRWKKSHNEEYRYVCDIHQDYIHALRNSSYFIGPNFPKLRLGNLDAFRDWGYAEDYVEAMWLMLQQDNPEDYVICTGDSYTVREFLDTAFKYVGIEDWSNLVVQDPLYYRPSEVDYLRGDCSKAKQKLGWFPKTSFRDLVHKMVDGDINEKKL